MKQTLEALFQGHILSASEAEAVLEQILSAEVPAVSTGALLGALRMRGEQPSEIVGFAQALRKRMQRVKSPEDALDTCGTGGDGGLSFNVSTAVGLVLASLGLPVVKHGNRAVSSRCGSADVLERLGITVHSSPAAVEQALAETGFGFCFAPAFHPILKQVAPLRQSLGVRTIFNLLGPLCNPGEVRTQLLGVYSPTLTLVLAETLKELEVKSAWVVSSEDGMDELSLSCSTHVAEWRDGHLRQFLVSPEDAGLKRQEMSSIGGGSVEENAELMLRLCSGETGVAHDLVCYNAAAALYVAKRVQNLREGVEQARKALCSGRVMQTLEKLKTQTPT